MSSKKRGSLSLKGHSKLTCFRVILIGKRLCTCFLANSKMQVRCETGKHKRKQEISGNRKGFKQPIKWS